MSVSQTTDTDIITAADNNISDTAELREMLAGGASTDDILSSLVKKVRKLKGIKAAAVFLPEVDDSSIETFEVLASSGGEVVPKPTPEKFDKEELVREHPLPTYHKGDYLYTKVAVGSTLGWLGTRLVSEPSDVLLDQIDELAFYAALANEHPSLRERVGHATAKIEVLNELNKLIASGVDLNRIMRTVAREAAFRFSAKCSIAFFLNEAGTALECMGSYGAPPKAFPEEVILKDTQIGRALKLGGIMSIPNLSAHKDLGIEFLDKFGIKSAHVSSVDFRGEVLGAIVIGYSDDRELSILEGDMFESFSRGAAVAISNSVNQSKLTKYTNKLEELVEERTADLAVQMTRADEANMAKSRFVANMSHELRTPLTAILGYSSVIAEGIFGPVNTEQEDALKAIARAADHLKELINDVLDASKVEAGKDDPEPSEVEIYDLLQQVGKLMMQSAMGKGVKLRPLSIPDSEKENPVRAWIDARHIRQVLINLMSNAIKYTPEGGDVSVNIEPLGDKIKISVVDTGVGISPADLEKLFERFTRSEHSYSQAQVGTGIGLDLTKRLVELNGGKIGVESTPGQGSSFWILIPALSEQQGSQSVQMPEGQKDLTTTTRLDGLNILLVDDNHLTCEVLQTIITSVGGNAFVAHSVKEAKELAQTTSLDTALIDLAMPGESGLDLLDYFREEHESGATMPLIVVSACVFDTDKREAINHGANTFVAKPFSPVEIVTTIRELTTSAILNT
jgi:signal transduction histidine kinase/ActR/RegA family two-component response regulator